MKKSFSQTLLAALMAAFVFAPSFGQAQNAASGSQMIFTSSGIAIKSTPQQSEFATPEWMAQHGYTFCSNIEVPPSAPGDCKGAGGANGDTNVTLLPNGRCFTGLNCK